MKIQQIYIFTNNLFFKPKLEILLKQLNYDSVFLKSISDISETKIKIILDADHPALIEITQKYPEQCYIFISHIKTELIEQLKQLGCKNVYPRSVFFLKFERIIK